MFNISEELKKLPQDPGVYIMKDENDIIIYVGKSVNIKQRVRQYFQQSSYENIKTKLLAAQIRSFEYIVTNNEVEALILENNLIKENRPKYNVMLKDDKTYPYIKITNEMFPRVIKVRQVKKDNANYFGPYSDFVANETIKIIHSVWPIRSSKKVLPRDLNKSRPCLNYHIGKCKAPCASLISEEEYKKIIKQVIDFIESKYDNLIKVITIQMEEASAALNFEYAATLRDRIEAIKSLKQKQTLENVTSQDQDVIAMYRDGSNENYALVQIFFIRGGKMTGRESIFLDNIQFLSDSNVLSSFVKQFYSDLSYVPKEILLQEELEDQNIIKQWLNTIGNSVKITVPKRGDKHSLVLLAAKNARVTLDQFGLELRQQNQRTIGAVEAISIELGIKNMSRIEAYDISNIQGYESVGSMVVFEDGRPKTSDYRKFKIKTVKGPNDYESMSEIIERRFKRYLDSQSENSDSLSESFSKIPSVIFVDGGKGQINISKEVLDQLGLDIPVVGMVKDDSHRTRGLIYENREINFPKTSEAFKLISKIQDEVHRFAVEYHRKLRRQTTLHSSLDEIKGIGKVKKTSLFKKFNSIENIKKATLEEIELTPGFTKKSAELVYNFFND